MALTGKGLRMGILYRGRNYTGQNTYEDNQPISVTWDMEPGSWFEISTYNISMYQEGEKKYGGFPGMRQLWYYDTESHTYNNSKLLTSTMCWRISCVGDGTSDAKLKISPGTHLNIGYSAGHPYPQGRSGPGESGEPYTTIIESTRNRINILQDLLSDDPFGKQNIPWNNDTQGIHKPIQELPLLSYYIDVSRVRNEQSFYWPTGWYPSTSGTGTSNYPDNWIPNGPEYVNKLLHSYINAEPLSSIEKIISNAINTNGTSSVIPIVNKNAHIHGVINTGKHNTSYIYGPSQDGPIQIWDGELNHGTFGLSCKFDKILSILSMPVLSFGYFAENIEHVDSPLYPGWVIPQDKDEFYNSQLPTFGVNNFTTEYVPIYNKVGNNSRFGFSISLFKIVNSFGISQHLISSMPSFGMYDTNINLKSLLNNIWDINGDIGVPTLPELDFYNEPYVTGSTLSIMDTSECTQSSDIGTPINLPKYNHEIDDIELIQNTQMIGTFGIYCRSCNASGPYTGPINCYIVPSNYSDSTALDIYGLHDTSNQSSQTFIYSSNLRFGEYDNNNVTIQKTVDDNLIHS